jgi:transposase
MAAISMDLRVRIRDAREAGETTAEVAERFSVCPSFVRRLMQRFRETGSVAPETGPRGPEPQLRCKHEEIRTHVAANPDHSPAEVRIHLELDVSVSTVRRAFTALGLTFKKSP